MSRHRLYDFDVWFDAPDAPAPSGVETDSAPDITVGVSGHAESAVVHVRYRRAQGPWQRLRLGYSHSTTDAHYFTGKFPELPAGSTIEYEVYVRCGGARPKPERRVGEKTSFEIRLNPVRAHPTAEDNPYTRGRPSDRTADIEPGAAVTPAVKAATPLADPGTPAIAAASDAVPAEPPLLEAETQHTVAGTAVLPPQWDAGVLIEAFADERLHERVGEARTNGDGRFRLALQAEPTSLWFQWQYGEERGRTPLLQPWRPGTPLRIQMPTAEPGLRRGDGTLEGQARTDDQRPVRGVRVWLVEVGLRKCQVMDQVVTGDDGGYRLTYAQDALITPDNPDLRVLLFDENNMPLIESRDTTITVPCSSVAVPSLYDRIHRSVYDILGRSEQATPPQLAPEDLAYVAERTALPIETLVTYTQASVLSARIGIDEASAFALAESGPTTAPAEALKEAVERGSVPRSILQRIPATETAILRSLGTEAAKQDLGRGSLDDVLALRISDPEARQALGAKLLGATGGAELTRTLDNKDPAPDSGLRFVLDVTDTVGTDAPLAAALSRAFDRHELRTAADPAGWTTTKWKTWLRSAAVDIPLLFANPGAEEQGLHDYARHLQRRFETRFPAQALRAYADRNAQHPWANQLGGFLDLHPGFDLSKPLSEVVASNLTAIDGETGGGVGSWLLTMQRLVKLTRSLAPLPQLIQEGFRSASSITSIGHEEFIQRFTPAFDGSAAEAAAAYARAKRRTALARYTHSALSNDFHRSGFTALEYADLRPEDKQQAVRALGLESEAQLELTWHQLFGSSELSFCECTHCRSVFGPAAYLFDMLLFLRQYTAGEEEGGLPLLDHFAARRPDVPLVRLSCDNTNIEVPQIDLVNELLCDLIAATLTEPGEDGQDCTCDGDSKKPEPPGPIECADPAPPGAAVFHPAGPGTGISGDPRDAATDPCAPPDRQTTGTSPERRAFPQNEPPASVLSRLSNAAYPWTLPYDYARDRARSARKELPARGEDLALAVWRFTVTTPDLPDDDTTRVLAAHMLDLSQAERKLLTKPPHSLATVWGPGVAAAVVAGTGPSAAALERASGLDYPGLEAVLDTRFVRGTGLQATETVTLEPPESCDLETLHLTGDRAALCAVLDRMHRFERLRRHLGWASHQLDEALRWAGPGLNQQTLEHIGILRFLELRLDVSPDTLLALFRDPDPLPPATLRPGRLASPFETLFGPVTFALPDPSGYGVSDAELSDLVAAQIEQRVGEGPDVVSLALTQGFAGDLTSAAAIVSSPDPQAACRRAVAAVYRVATWAALLHLSPEELVHLLELNGLQPIPRHGTTVDPATRLRDAVAFVDLAARARHWPVDISEARYIVTGAPDAARTYAPTASDLGLELLKLHNELATTQATEQARPADALAALRAELTELFKNARTEKPATGQAAELIADRLASLLEWSIFLPELEAEAKHLLPAATTDGWDTPTYQPAELAGAASAWSEALNSLPATLQEWLQQELAGLTSTGTAGPPSVRAPDEAPPVEANPSSGTDPDDGGPWTTASFLAAAQALRALVIETAKNPADSDLTALANALQSFVATQTTHGLSGPAATTLAARYRDDALTLLAARLEDWRQLAARQTQPRLQSARRRMRTEQLLIDWVTRTFSIDESTAGMLLHLLKDPSDATRDLLRAFVAKDGSTPHLTESLPVAEYMENPAGTPVPGPGNNPTRVVRERREPSLSFDWSAFPPPPGMDSEHFQVTVRAAVPTGRLKAGGQSRRMAVESDGHVQARLRAGDLSQVILDAAPAGQVSRHEVDPAKLDSFVSALGGSPPDVISVELTYTSPEAAGPRVMRLLVAATDGTLDDLRPGTLTDGVLRLEKAARLVRSLKLPQMAWAALAVLQDPAARIDLAALPVEAGSWIRQWSELTALAELWRRQSATEAAGWLALVTGGTVPLLALGSLLNLAPQELEGVLQLLELQPTGDEVRFAQHRDPVHLVAALNLADQARRIGLPVRALAQWTSASADEIYQWSLAALRSQHSAEEWLDVAAAIHDPVREHLRDALTAWLVTHERRFQDKTAPAFASPEAISAYLFTDIQMTSCMPTSRIQFAYAAVQRYIDAARMGYEVGPARGDQEDCFEREWDWRRNYRLWEANRRVFTQPENWLEPDIRPGKTGLFEQFEQDLLAGPLTSQSAERALAAYVAGLVEVARPEILATVHQEELADFDSPLGFRDPDLRGTHVFARSRTQPRQLLYRRRLPLPDGRWTAWERLDVELEGTHYLAVVAFGRLRLICAEMAAASAPQVGQCDTAGTDASAPRYEASLAWIDRRHGQWSPVSRSGRFSFTVPLTDRPSDEELWARFPQSQFPPVQIDATNRVTHIAVQAWWGEDGIEKDSKLTAAIVDPGGGTDAEINWLKPPDDVHARSSRWLFANDIPSRIDAEKISRIRLTWEPRVSWGSFDDVRFVRLMVYFSNAAKRLLHSTSITTGIGRDKDGKSASLTIPFFMDWNRTFEGWLDQVIQLGTLAPALGHFEVDYDLLPRTVDLSQSVRIEARIGGTDSFTLVLHSNDHIRTGRIRPRFRLRPGVAASFPEVKGHWPEDWVTGEEMCFPYRTVPQPLSALRIFSDGSVAQESPPYAAPGQHPGTRAEGQLLLSMSIEGPPSVYGGNTAIAHTPGPYQLVLRRDQVLSGYSSPKLLDEISSAATGRTFLIEQVQRVLSVASERELPLVPGWEVTRQAARPEPPPKCLAAALHPDSTAALLAGPAPMPHAVTRTPVRASPGLLMAAPDSSSLAVPKPWNLWAFRVFWHPQATGFLRILEARGTPRLLRIENQTLAAGSDLDPERARVDFFDSYYPTSAVVMPWPRADVDFSIDGAYADYNWELFFHAPLLIAQRLSEAGRFEESERWFRFLFDPTKLRPGDPRWEVFQTQPLREATVQRVQDMLDLLVDGTLSPEFAAQVERLNMYPYQPHLIARGRPSAYAMALMMRYIDHLIRWGDMLFRRAYAGDNRTDLETASSRYDLAVRLLGHRPEALPERGPGSASCFAAIADSTKTPPELWDPVVRLENLLPDHAAPAERLPHDGAGIPRLYFCIPHNDKLDGYWNTLADRLTKLRSCRDIDGIRRALSLYGRRIDPGLLVRATAEGIDLDVLLGRLAAPLPAFRFQSLAARATSACERARQFSDALLAALQNRDAEELGRLRHRHEIALLEAGLDIRAEQLQEAEASRDALLRAKQNAETRRDYYATRERISHGEAAEGRTLEAAGTADTRGGAAARTASDWAWVPSLDFFAEGGAQYPGVISGTPPTPIYAFARAGASGRYTVGGQTLAQVNRNNAEAQAREAAAGRVQAGLVGRQAGFDRRQEDWQHQEALASGDIQQLDRQVTAAQIRVRISELEQQSQRTQLDNAKLVDAFLRDKFTNAQLYRWTESRLTQIHYQQYRIAYDLAALSQAALARELGLDDQPPLPDTWNPAHRGLGAAADLLLELEKLQRQYVDGWRREHEKTKHYSLAERDPQALLELRQRGECTFQIQEHELDEDEPGDYFRRIRSVSLDIPCIRGPYTSVNARLTLLRSSIRLRAHTSPDADDYPRAEGPEGADDQRFRDDPGSLEHIVTSTAVADHGLFDADSNNEAPRPFEGAGMIATWRLELRPAANHFDRTTVTDAVLHLQYTSRAGGEPAAAAARAARADRLAERPEVVMFELESMPAADWHRFVTGADGEHELRLLVAETDISYRLRPLGRIVGTDLYFELPAGEQLRITGGTAVGTVTEPTALAPLDDDPRPPLPIRRLRLRQPLRAGLEQRVRLVAGSGIPRRGWLACWVRTGSP
jgi:hypothetical protein